MDLKIEDLNKIISTFVSDGCSDELTEQCLKKLILYTSQNDILLSHLSNLLKSNSNQLDCLFKSLMALHYTIDNGDQKFLHFLAANNLNLVNLDKHKQKFSNANSDYLSFLKRYVYYLQQKISVYKVMNMESSWLTKLTQKPLKQALNVCGTSSDTGSSDSSNASTCSLSAKNEESVLQHDIIGEQLMHKISFIENQINYLITEFNVENLEMLFIQQVLEHNQLETRHKIIEHVFRLLLNDVINYANYLQDIMRELVEQFELMNRKHCKDAIEVYRKLPEKIDQLREFLFNCNEKLMCAHNFEPIDLNNLTQPSIELQEKIENHWEILESKPKRKNSERRKEKSKYAARVRRSEESDLLNELSELIPLPDVKLQDKASVMRLAISFINTKQFIQNYTQSKKSSTNETQNENAIPEFLFNDPASLDVLKTSNLILACLSLDGDLVFISSNVVDLIGLKQTEMLEMSIFDFVHPCDHDELKNSLKQISEARRSNGVTQKTNNNAYTSSDTSSSNASNSTSIHELVARKNNQMLFEERNYVSFMVRIKCTLNNKNKCLPFKSANYKMASFSGYLKESKTRPLLVLSIDILLSHSAQLKCAGSSVFVTKHSMDLKFLHTDDKLTNLLGYDEKDLIGCSFFQYIHASDAFQLFDSFQKLLSKGEVETGYYRFLSKTGGYFWIQTKASLLNDHSTQKPQTILCIHYLISELIASGIIMSSKQLQASNLDSVQTNENTITMSSGLGKKSACKSSKSTKKVKSSTNRAPKINATNSMKKIDSNIKSTMTHKKSTSEQTVQIASPKDDLNALNDRTNITEKLVSQEDQIMSDQILCTNELCARDLKHFVQDCKEFDCVLEKIKFKEQFKKEFEAQLNSRMMKRVAEPRFNTFTVFSPLQDDQCTQIEPSIDLSPLIATPISIDCANKVDMECMSWNSENSNETSVDQMKFVTNSLISSTVSCRSSDTNKTNCDSLDYASTFSTDSLSNVAQQATELVASTQSIGKTNSISTPLTERQILHTNAKGFFITYPSETELEASKKQDVEENINWIPVAPQAGDSCITLDFDDMPASMDAETERLIKELSGLSDSLSDSSSESSLINDNTILNQNQTISTIDHLFNEPLSSSATRFEQNLAFENYTPTGKSAKIPNHFNDSIEITKKPRYSFDSHEITMLKEPLLSPSASSYKGINSKSNSSSVLLNLLVNGQDLENGYL